MTESPSSLTMLLSRHTRRRAFIALLGGTAAWPLAARRQEAGRVRRVGFLRVGPPPPSYIGGFRQGLREQGLVGF